MTEEIIILARQYHLLGLRLQFPLHAFTASDTPPALQNLSVRIFTQGVGCFVHSRSPLSTTCFHWNPYFYFALLPTRKIPRVELYMSSSVTSYSMASQQSKLLLQFETDRKECTPGDTAVLSLFGSHSPHHALIAILYWSYSLNHAQENVPMVPSFCVCSPFGFLNSNAHTTT